MLPTCEEPSSFTQRFKKVGEGLTDYRNTSETENFTGIHLLVETKSRGISQAGSNCSPA